MVVGVVALAVVMGSVPARSHPVRERVLARAQALVGTKDLAQLEPGLPNDCTGLVRAAYDSASVELLSANPLVGENGVSWIWRGAKERRALLQSTPRPGDLIFFRETYDRNRDGLRNDGLTHVGVVERVDPSGVITFIHRASAGVVRSRVNLFRPTEHRSDEGALMNDFLRAKEGRHRAYLTGELFVGFASAAQLSEGRLVQAQARVNRSRALREINQPVAKVAKAKATKAKVAKAKATKAKATRAKAASKAKAARSAVARK